MSESFTAFGAGKVILLGEHAVVYGESALAAPISRGVFATVHRASKPAIHVPKGANAAQARLLRKAFARACGLAGSPKVSVALRSTLPLSMGLGSSAAVSVACAKVLLWATGQAESTARVERLALEMEREFHVTPSGVDHTTSARQSLLLFRAGKATEVSSPKPLKVAVMLLGPRPATRNTVAALRERASRWPKRYKRTMAMIGELAREGAVAVRAGDYEGLGDAMNLNHGLLAGLRLSSPAIDNAVHALRSVGALGAKLTGGGGDGGAVIGLFREPEPAIVKLRRQGFDCFASQLAGPGAL